MEGGGGVRESQTNAYASCKFRMLFVIGTHPHNICHHGTGQRTYPAWLMFWGLGEG